MNCKSDQCTVETKNIKNTDIVADKNKRLNIKCCNGHKAQYAKHDAGVL